MGARAAVALGIAAYLVFLAASVPAAFVAPRLAAALGPRAEILAATGTAWRGEAKARLHLPGAATIEVERVAWRFLPLRLAAGEAAAAIEARAPGASATLEAARGISGWRVRDLKADAEARALAAAFPLVSTWQPGGTLALSAARLEAGGHALSGEARLEWKDATSALSAIRPLGSYAATLRASGGPAAVELATLAGALRLSGRGTLEASGRLELSGEARAEGPRAAELEPLLALLGPRRADGAHAIAWRVP